MTSTASYAANLNVALLHHPVKDKHGRSIAAAVTSLDLHDIARAARTYGSGAFYVATPLRDQQALVRQIVAHWVSGYGASYNPHRREALALIRLEPSLEAVKADVETRTAAKPWTVATSASGGPDGLSYAGLGELVRGQRPVLLLFGTAWGLAPEVLEQVDYRLDPIEGPGAYNHLAVRSAVAIILDRLFGRHGF